MRHLPLVLTMLLFACAPRAKVADGVVATAMQAPPGDAVFDHSAWARVLSASADPAAGRVDYDAVAAHRADLDAYVAQLATADLVRMSADARKATLINAYNAFTLVLIVEQTPRPASIRDLDKPWDTARWVLAGETVSLNHIEHGLLRPITKDPRLHFVLNCASIGCPALADTPYQAAGLDARLSEATAAALSQPQHARLEGDTLVLTKLFDWYGGDFTAEGWSPVTASIPAWVAAHGPPELAGAAVAKSVRFQDYDWALNDGS